ncbi:MAG: GNAT family N-acetyltransferase [Gammaproteobacteria bacterium]|nr:GNAT family N-acetyltransferase [Gammaproteobacteria bacterium]
MSYLIELTRLSDVTKLENDWLNLERDADCSYFQSWGWIGTWIAEIAKDMPCEVVRVREQGELVAIGVLVKTHVKRFGLLKSQKLFLNEAPVANRNMVIEYNGLLVKHGHELLIYKEVIYHLRYASNDWDEISLSMLKESVSDCFIRDLDDEFYLTVEKESTSWQFDSAETGNNVDKFFSSLSKNRRYQIRKSIKIYEKEGSINVVEASTVKQAQLFFSGLKKLHTGRWNMKGKGGSFSNVVWERFHRAIIENRFCCGEVQLLKVSTPKSEIGYIYSFIWRGRVYVLQTGFNMDGGRNSQPGYVSHIKAICHNNEKRNFIYDLLSDDSGYKAILCNSSEKLVSVSFKRIAFRSMVRQFSLSDVKSGYVKKVVGSSLSDKIKKYGPGAIDFIREKWIDIFNKWPSSKKKYLLVGSESSGTTAVSDLLFKEVEGLRYLEEGEHQWVWSAYRSIYQNTSQVKDYPRLHLFDAIKVPGFSMIIGQYLEQFPNTDVIYLVRDPRDFASSAIKTWKIGAMSDFIKVPWTDIGWMGIKCDDAVACLAYRWKTYLNTARKTSGVTFIRYEDFCNDKVGVIENLSIKLKLPFDRERVERLCNIQLSHGSVRAYKPSGPGGWKDSILDEQHIKLIEDICREEMLTFNYEVP